MLVATVALVATTVIAGAVAATPAAAHETDSSIHPVLDEVSPAVPGLTVQVAASVTAQLVVSNPTPAELSVLDDGGRPFLRIGPDGVLADTASPWWYLSNSPNGDATIPAGARPGAPARWARVAAEPAWGWFDHRLHPSPGHVSPAVTRRHAATLGTWSVPFDYDGRSVTARGRIVYERVRGAVTTRLRGPVRPFREVAVQLAPGRVPALFLSNRGDEPVVVLGASGEPFLRVGEDGTEVNRHSPTWADNARARGQDLAVAAAVADPGALPEWAPETATPAYSWLEFRGLYTREQPPRRVLEGQKTAVLRAWAIPLVRGGRRVDLQGETVWKPVKR